MNVSSVASVSTAGVAGAGHGHGPRQLPQEAIDALADKLGMSSDDLKSKLDASNDPRKTLDQLAQEKGVSTDELHEAVRNAMAAKRGQDGPAGPPPPPPGGGSGPSFDDPIGQKVLSNLADKMGMSVDDLKSQLDAGTDLRDLLESKGVSKDDVRDAFEQAIQSFQSYGANGSTSSAASCGGMVDVQA